MLTSVKKFLISSFYSNLAFGIFFVSIACACWAYAFIIPIILKSFLPSQIAIFRYFFYGIFSLIIFLYSNKGKSYSLKVWIVAFLLALTGNVLYYYMLIIGINYAGAQVAIPIGGMIPITVAIIGNIFLKEFSFSKVFVPLLMSFLGLVIINFTYFSIKRDLTHVSALGLLACFTSLILWSVYGVSNSFFLKKNQYIDSSTWTSMIGIMSLLQAIIWGSLEMSFNTKNFINQFKSLYNVTYLCFWAATLGILSSWLGTIAWNIGSKRLPVTLAGQIIVMEPIFGLIYIFILKGSLPTTTEFIGYFICILGIVLTLKRIQNSSGFKLSIKEDSIN